MESLLDRIERTQGDLTVVERGQGFNRIRANSELLKAWVEATTLASRWISRLKPDVSKINEADIRSVFLFAEGLIAIGNGEGLRGSETVLSGIGRLSSEFRATLPLVAFEVFHASGILGVSEVSYLDWKDEAIGKVRTSVQAAEVNLAAYVADAIVKIRASADEAAKDFESAKAKASKITVDIAQEQFRAAAASFKRKALGWSILTAFLFFILLFVLLWLLKYPPALIHEVTEALKPGSNVLVLKVPVPLLIATSAYFTGIRLGIIGVLGIGMAFSLRMTRAYLHMIEHNHHKLRVTNSIEAFVAAVSTSDQKDLVLGKLVESVTEFGDPGIIGKDGEGAGFPSVIIEAMTKNVGKVR